MAAVAAWRPDVAYGARPAPLRGRSLGMTRSDGEPKQRSASGGRVHKALALAVLALVLLAGAGSIGSYWLYPWILAWTESQRKPADPQPPILVPPQQQQPRQQQQQQQPQQQQQQQQQQQPQQQQQLQFPSDAVQRTERYANSYQGGDCFLATPSTATNGLPALDVFATSVADSGRFQTEFKRANGFDATISPQLITPAQCPALSFLSRLRGAAGVPPRLDVGAPVVRSGSAMTGTVSGIGDRAIELLLVADDGLAYNITSWLAGAGDSRPFSVKIKLVESGTAKPQLVLGIAASRPLASLRPGAGGSLGAADALFPRVLNEARQAGQTLNASAKLFRLEN
jgi:serine/threonine-protein kinase